MGRIEKAMQRAGSGVDETSDPRIDGSTVENDPTQFVVSEVVEEAPEPAPASRNPGAMIVRDAPVPMWTETRRPVSGDDVQLIDLLQTLYRRRWLICGVVAAFIATAVAYNTFATRLYEARARLIIEPSSPEVVTFRPVVAEDAQRTEEYFRTQVEILRSRALAQKTLETLGLIKPGVAADQGQVNGFLASLTITPVPQSRLVDLGFRSEDRILAARFANAHAAAYVAQNLESLSQPSRDASQWLTERLGELRQQVDSAQSALQQYRENRDAISLEGQQNVVVQKLTQLNAIVTTARTERIAKQALYDQLRSLEQSGAPLDTFPPVASNTFVQGLKTELAALQRQRAQLGEHLGDLHPEMVKIDTSILDAERRLNAEIQKVVSAVRSEFAAAQANERELLNALQQQNQEVLSLNRASIGYGALQRDAESAQQIFESVLQRYKEANLTAELKSNNIRILDAAVVPNTAVWPRASLNLFVALFGGLFVAVGLVFGLEYLNRRVDSPDDIGETLGIPVLGITPRVAGPSRQLEGPENSVPAVFREALRGIRARILLSPSAASVRTFVVTSAMAKEGKTVVASNLAVSLAKAGRRVLLIDGDMRRPRLHRLHNVMRAPGLSNVLTGSVRVAEALRKSRVDGLFVLPAGIPVSNPADLLETHLLKDLLAQLSDDFDLILIDSPPVMAVADASVIANAASAALFVVGAGAATKETIQAAIERLSAVQTQVIGVVMNKVRPVREAQYYYPDDATDGYVDDDAESFVSTPGRGTYA
jgi:capsular exopolysaccharide synthesis family protein